MMCGMRPHTAVIRIHDAAGNVIEKDEHESALPLKLANVFIPQD